MTEKSFKADTLPPALLQVPTALKCCVPQKNAPSADKSNIYLNESCRCNTLILLFQMLSNFTRIITQVK